jgi:hypothetical protein
VFDRVGPQIFFANSREEAVREVGRANEIVRLHPATLSMRHLREMDAAWRRENGLPPLPEPEGRTVVITREVPQPSAPIEPGWSPTVAAVLEIADLVSERDALRSRVDQARDALQRTRALGREVVRTWTAAETSIASMRTALRTLYGPLGNDAERDLRAALAKIPPGRSAAEYSAVARRFIASRQSAVDASSANHANTVALCAPAIAAWDCVAEAAAIATGELLRHGVADRAHHRALLSSLVRMRGEAEGSLEAARASFAAAAAGPGPRSLRERWRELSPADRRAVMEARPGLPELMRRGDARARGRRSPGSGGMAR